MWENVNGYEINWGYGNVQIVFFDIVGKGGEIYTFNRADAIKIRDALDQAIEEMDS